jgi:Mg-chelatase subunit ChlI
VQKGKDQIQEKEHREWGNKAEKERREREKTAANG